MKSAGKWPIHLPACFASGLSETWSNVEVRWQPHPTDCLTPICCGCQSCGGELGSAWVAGQHTGPPWLAPVILPSHSSARDINNNRTSGFTLLSRVNPFHCTTNCYCSGWPGPNPRPPLPTQVPFLLLSVFISPFHLLLHCFPFLRHRKPASLTWKTLWAHTDFCGKSE